MKNQKVIVIVLFISCLVVPLPLSLMVYKENNETEKRERASFPTEFTNNYFNSINEFFNDHSPFRDAIINFYKNIDKKFEDVFYDWVISTFYSSNDKTSENSSYDSFISSEEGTIYSSEQDEEDSVDSHIINDDFDYDNILKYPYKDVGLPDYPSKIEGDVIYGRDKWLFYYGEGSLSDYRGKTVRPYETMFNYRNAVKELTDYCKSKGITFTMFVAPNKEQVYSDKMPTYEIVHKAKKMQRIAYFMEDGGVNNFVHPLNQLIEARNNYETYFQQDTHWNMYGAIVGTNELVKTMGFDPELDYIVTPVPKTGGDLASMLGVIGDEYNQYSVTYKSEVNFTASITEQGESIFETDLLNDKRCLMFGDSFMNGIAPLLCKYFNHYSHFHNSNVLSNKGAVLPALSKLRPGDHFVIECVERNEKVGFNVVARALEYLKEINGDI